jgi:hypothetical protein
MRDPAELPKWHLHLHPELAIRSGARWLWWIGTGERWRRRRGRAPGAGAIAGGGAGTGDAGARSRRRSPTAAGCSAPGSTWSWCGRSPARWASWWPRPTRWTHGRRHGWRLCWTGGRRSRRRSAGRPAPCRPPVCGRRLPRRSRRRPAAGRRTRPPSCAGVRATHAGGSASWSPRRSSGSSRPTAPRRSPGCGLGRTTTIRSLSGRRWPASPSPPAPLRRCRTSRARHQAPGRRPLPRLPCRAAARGGARALRQALTAVTRWSSGTPRGRDAGSSISGACWLGSSPKRLRTHRPIRKHKRHSVKGQHRSQIAGAVSIHDRSVEVEDRGRSRSLGR